MKSRCSFKLILFFALFAAVFESCQKDDETEPSLSVAERAKFLGAWITQSNGSVHGTLNFTMTITAGSSSASQIKMENFDAEGNGTFVLADVSGNSISILQNIVNGDTIQGNGYYNSNNTLTLNYTFRDGQTVDNRTATAHK